MYYPYSENKRADQLFGYAKLICSLVFTYAKSRFSHEAAHMILQFPFKECLCHIKLLIKIEISFRIYVRSFSESNIQNGLQDGYQFNQCHHCLNNLTSAINFIKQNQFESI